ncbi:hypothetical protein [Belnapia rosea]|uniref:Uncharacterized protein n=1 Tax=Belnapia rosea TaxID=938405 RepID=A0A1G7E606_9PROT|nr:hypothetical protein [Belnapia rosea]SDE58910.1 hypothetical protein SAMN04487779_10624 [Belnapia rosea]
MTVDARANHDAPRQCIRIVPGRLPDIIDQAEQALLESDLGLYQRGSLIVRLGTVLITIAGGKEVAAQRIREVGEHALVEAMTAAADWERCDVRKRKWTGHVRQRGGICL